MKLKAILICLLIGFGLALQAQTISVKSFQVLPMDMTASSLEGKRIDQNGQVAALIKVVTSQTGFTFEGGTLGIVETQQRNGEIWVWVPRASRKITILHQQLGVLRDYRYPIEIEAERTYEMVLTTGKVETIVKQEVTQQYLAFQISPANAVLEVEGQLWEVAPDGSAMKFVNFGTYTYRVQAPNYHPEVGKVTVNDPEKTQKVVVTLKPDFVEVTLKVDADAEIWVNNEKKGTRSWTGNLGKGTYKIECKQTGHETSMITKEITADLNGQTIDLPKPTPIYGSLNIESSPNFATIYIDGKMVGETPKFLPEVLAGEHMVRLSVKGFKDYVRSVSIKKEENAQIRAVLQSVETPEKSIKEPIEQAKKSKWKVSLGWNIFDMYFGKKVTEMETGIRLKFGEDIFSEEKKLINFLFGVDVQYFLYSYPSDEYNDIDWPGSMAKLAIPASVRLNLGKRDTRCYLGLGAILYPNFTMSNINPCIAIEPQLGLTALGFVDFGLHLRYMPNEYGLTGNSEIKYMVGWYWAIYFP